MNCAKPYIGEKGMYGCGQCIPCRINRRRIWTHRIMLEAAQYEDNAFVTLTYNDESLPADGSVRPRVLQLFMKRLRKRQPELRIRYFACGEYGDESKRPHYHVALFGYPNCIQGQTAVNRSGFCCFVCQAISDAWQLGNVYLGGLSEESAAYVAGYVVKKMTRPDDPRLGDLAPEFARMSLRPGIGLGMMHEISSTLLQHKLDEKMIDVPLALQHGKRQLPLGRYLRRKLREFIGREANTPLEALKRQEAELQAMRKVAWDHQAPLSEIVDKETLGRRRRIEGRAKLYRKRGTI